MKFHVVG